MGSLFSHESKTKKRNHSHNHQLNGNNRPVRKDDEITEKDRAVLDLKNSKDRLKKYKKKVNESNIDDKILN